MHMGGCQMEYNEKYNINYKIRNKLCIFETQRKICIYNINVLACKLYVYDIYIISPQSDSTSEKKFYVYKSLDFSTIQKTVYI